MSSDTVSQRPNPPVAGVIGWPISHSKSPVIHSFWLNALGIDGHYSRFPIAPEGLHTAIRALPVLGIRGVNVTIPHKQAVMEALDEIAPAAQAIGAVNTVVVTADGRLAGHNTDVAGFAEPLRGYTLAGRPACVVGAGGAARAVLAALKGIGVSDVRVINRSVDKAESLLAEFALPGRVYTFDQSATALEGAALVVNTSSLGMKGYPPLELDLAPVASDAVIYDIVYAPLETDLLRQAKARGLRTVDGLSMLVGQAADAFRLFYDAEPPRDEATEAELRARLLA
ncbi:MAG TPA: shikimate dehydrogenase [Pedomonas sp.]|uniref:shikimate dehydrogenase n=1 Tax=Pedomonas sp. TaxID=2976421 RepID=UPI002F3ED929